MAQSSVFFFAGAFFAAGFFAAAFFAAGFFKVAMFQVLLVSGNTSSTPRNSRNLRRIRKRPRRDATRASYSVDSSERSGCGRDGEGSLASGRRVRCPDFRCMPLPP